MYFTRLKKVIFYEFMNAYKEKLERATKFAIELNYAKKNAKI